MLRCETQKLLPDGIFEDPHHVFGNFAVLRFRAAAHADSTDDPAADEHRELFDEMGKRAV